jgi:Tfp pilus assembly protein PilP
MMKTRIEFRRILRSASNAVSWISLAIAAASAEAGSNTGSNTDLQDLKTWLATARQQSAVSVIAPSPAPADRTSNQMQTTMHIPMQTPTPTQIPTQAQPQAEEAIPADRIIAMRDPFSRLAPEVAVPSSVRDIPAKETALHLLGTVRDGNTAYALIKADRQVLCIASNAFLPSYAIKVTSITDHAVALDRLLPDGSHQRSTLRLGE